MNKFFSSTLALLFALSVQAADREDVPPPPPPGDDFAPPGNPPPEHNRGERGGKKGEMKRDLGPASWRAFSALSEEERQALMTLQRNDPEAFREKLRELGEKQLEADRKRFEALKAMVDAYRKSSDEAEKAQLRAKITEHIRADYLARLEENRRHLEEMKARAAQLEEELNKRAAKATEAINARVEAVLSGRFDKKRQRD